MNFSYFYVKIAQSNLSIVHDFIPARSSFKLWTYSLHRGSANDFQRFRRNMLCRTQHCVLDIIRTQKIVQNKIIADFLWFLLFAVRTSQYIIIGGFVFQFPIFLLLLCCFSRCCCCCCCCGYCFLCCWFAPVFYAVNVYHVNDHERKPYIRKRERDGGHF